jgi:hypothetical protein
MRKVLIAVSAVAMLGACASRPEPTPTPEAPAPTNPTQPSQGPTPGSVEDFRVSVGDRVFFGYDRQKSFQTTDIPRKTLWHRQAQY